MDKLMDSLREVATKYSDFLFTARYKNGRTADSYRSIRGDPIHSADQLYDELAEGVSTVAKIVRSPPKSEKRCEKRRRWLIARRELRRWRYRKWGQQRQSGIKSRQHKNRRKREQHSGRGSGYSRNNDGGGGSNSCEERQKGNRSTRDQRICVYSS
jgi:hypothetical protein